MDKVLRIAGRSGSGLAKPLKTDENGNLQTKEVGSVIGTKAYSGVPVVNPTERRVLINVEKECVIESLWIEFQTDGIGDQTIEFELLENGVYTMYRIPLSPGTYTAWITPSTIEYDPLFAVIVNDSTRKIIKLDKPLRVKGFKLTGFNRNATIARTYSYGAVITRIEE